MTARRDDKHLSAIRAEAGKGQLPRFDVQGQPRGARPHVPDKDASLPDTAAARGDIPAVGGGNGVVKPKTRTRPTFPEYLARAIQAAIDRGDIDATRYNSYVKLRAEATAAWPRW